MSSLIYLVEVSWNDYDAGDHWFPAVFTTKEAAEQYRQVCQNWIDDYTNAFWEEYAHQFGEPRERRHFEVYTPETAEDRQKIDWWNPGNLLAEQWFGYRCPLAPGCTEHGRDRMRRLGPDPLIDMSWLAGSPCYYRVIEVPLNPKLTKE
jgi:hypothetical protein